MILKDNYGKHNGRKDIICCLMGWNIDNLRKEIEEMTNEDLTGTTAEELKEAQDYFDEYYNPIPQKKEEKKKVKNNVMLNELFNRLIEQANTIKELEKDNEMLRNERKLIVEQLVRVEKEKDELKNEDGVLHNTIEAYKTECEMKDKEIESLKNDVMNKLYGIDSSHNSYSQFKHFLEWLFLHDNGGIVECYRDRIHCYEDARQFEDGIEALTFNKYGDVIYARETD